MFHPGAKIEGVEKWEDLKGKAVAVRDGETPESAQASKQEAAVPFLYRSSDGSTPAAVISTCSAAPRI